MSKSKMSLLSVLSSIIFNDGFIVAEVGHPKMASSLEAKALQCGFEVVDHTLRYPANGPKVLAEEQIQFLNENKGSQALFLSAKVHNLWVASQTRLPTNRKATITAQHLYSMRGYENYPRDRSRLDRDHMYAMISIAAACRAGLRDEHDSKVPHKAHDVGCVIRTSALVHNRRQVIFD